jgi:spoIIIJ-associated protein
MAVSDLDRARDVLAEILKLTGIEANVEVHEDDERILLDVKGPESGLVIGKKGQTLDALQYMVGKIVHRGLEGEAEYKPIVVDTEGYRARRIDTLIEMAQRLGEKAVRTSTTIMMDPMSPHDRRIIHMTLDKVPGVTTRSEGEGAYRRLLIVPAPDKA